MNFIFGDNNKIRHCFSCNKNVLKVPILASPVFYFSLKVKWKLKKVRLRNKFDNYSVKMSEEKKGRGFKIAQLIKEATEIGRPSGYQSPVENVMKKLEDINIDSSLRGAPQSQSSGRGKLMASLVAQVKQSQELEDQYAKLPENVPGLGRGHFLKALAKQSLLKKARGWDADRKEVTTIGPDEIERPLSHDNKSLSETLSTLEAEDESLPQCTKGEVGVPFKALTNYIALKVDPDKKVYEYYVAFTPQVDFAAFRFKLLKQHFRFRKGINCYDGGSKLFLPEKVTDSKIEVKTEHPNDGSPVTIIIEIKQEITLKESEQLYNVLFNNCAKMLKFARLGKQSYDYNQSHQIPQYKLEVWPGYVTSVKEYDGGLMLCCDIKHRVLRTETAYDVICNIAKFDPTNFRTIVTRELLGQCVLTRYNNNLYRIDDVNWDKTPLSTFKLASGKEISFMEYYLKQYNLQITDVKQPLLLSKQKSNRVKGDTQLLCLVPEICHMTGLTDKMRNDMKVMKEISMYTRVTPEQRQLGFRKFLENIRNNSSAQEMLKEWGLTIANDPLVTEGRVLPVENIYFKNRVQVAVSSQATWSSQIKNHGLVRSTDMKHWILVHTSKDSVLATKFKETMKKVGFGLGMEVANPVMVALRNDKIESYIMGLKENVGSQTQLVVCLCPTARTDRYSAIKKFCCRERPVASQVINCGTIVRENRLVPVVQNVALQINNKLGGASWAIHVPLKNCMVCGIDTFHERGSNSVGAFVASLDADFTQWFSRAYIQEPNQELLDGLVCCFVSGLKKYLIINNSLPERVVIFRDGVGDGMLSFVRKHEVKQFLEACRLVGEDYKPKLSFVLVNKRINTKIFRMADHTGNLCNVEHGSILDHTVTKRNFYDFFLVSQHVSCGTATPSHYVVLYDNSGLKPDHMQRLTYKFCHLYYNWAGTVRIPAPCLYAHKLAYLVGQNLKGPPNEVLEDKLYYL